MKTRKPTEWRISFHIHMSESIYNEFKRKHGYIKLKPDIKGDCPIILRKFRVKAVIDIPDTDIKAGDEYMAVENYDLKFSHSKYLYVYKATAKYQYPEIYTDDISQYFEFYPDGIIPHKLKYKVKTHK